MEANGSWLVPTLLAAGIQLGIAPLPKGPAGAVTSINPTGAVVFKGTKNPDAAWEFVKYLASPAAQTKLMELKASLPANKEVLAGPYGASFDGAKVLADAIGYARIKPSFKGYNDFTTALQTELDENVFNANNKTVRQAIDDVLPSLNEILAGQ
jgi:multiple sugar transport system substrate-binding protein